MFKLELDDVGVNIGVAVVTALLCFFVGALSCASSFENGRESVKEYADMKRAAKEKLSAREIEALKVK